MRTGDTKHKRESNLVNLLRSNAEGWPFVQDCRTYGGVLTLLSAMTLKRESP